MRRERCEGAVGRPRRAIRHAISMLALVLAAAACSGDASSPAAPTSALAQPSTTTSTPETSTTTASTTTTTTPPPPGPASFTMSFSGDVLPNGPLNRRAAGYGEAVGARYAFDPMLEPLRPVLDEVDLAVCHLEVPVARDQDVITGYPSFGAPVELVDALARVGYDGCTTASNHSLDQGMAGLTATLDRFDAAGLGSAGTARSAQERDALTFYEVDGARVANLSYAYDFNGYRIPDDAPWAVNQIDPAQIRADAARARFAGAQLVVVSLHWGTEYQHEPSAYQRDIADQLLPSDDIDLIVGHHAHVVQPIEVIDGTYVVWGLGNQLSNQAPVPRADGLTVVVDASKRPDGRYEVVGLEAVPTFVDIPTHRVLPIVATLADPGTPEPLRQQLRDSYERTLRVLLGRSVPNLALDPIR